jgi:hypothetical protein
MLVSKATLRQRVNSVIKGLLDELAAERARERQLAMEVAEIQSRLRYLLAEQEQMRADVERCRKAEIERDQWRAAMQALSPGDNPDKTIGEVENWHFEMRRKLREQSKAIGVMAGELAALRAAVADAVTILEHEPLNTPQIVMAYLRTHAAAVEAATKGRSDRVEEE